MVRFLFGQSASRLAFGSTPTSGKAKRSVKEESGDEGRPGHPKREAADDDDLGDDVDDDDDDGDDDDDDDDEGEEEEENDFHWFKL